MILNPARRAAGVGGVLEGGPDELTRPVKAHPERRFGDHAHAPEGDVTAELDSTLRAGGSNPARAAPGGQHGLREVAERSRSILGLRRRVALRDEAGLFLALALLALALRRLALALPSSAVRACAAAGLRGRHILFWPCTQRTVFGCTTSGCIVFCRPTLPFATEAEIGQARALRGPLLLPTRPRAKWAQNEKSGSTEMGRNTPSRCARFRRFATRGRPPSLWSGFGALTWIQPPGRGRGAGGL